MPTFEQIKINAARAGYVTSPADDLAIAARRDAARERVAIEAKQELAALSGFERMARVFNRTYGPAVNGVIKAGDLIVTTALTLIVALGAPVAWLFVFWVEIDRVAAGVLLFIADHSHAIEAAAALIIVQTVLEIGLHFDDHRTGRLPLPRPEFSFVLWGKRLKYILGGKGWKQRERADLARSGPGIVSFCILMLATLGSIQPLIAAAPGNWRNGLGVMLAESNLASITAVFGGLILSVTLVITQRRLGRFMALSSLKTMDNLAAVLKVDDTRAIEAADNAAKEYLIARVAEWRDAKNAPALPPPPSTLPIGNPAPVSAVSETPGNAKQPTETLQKVINWFEADLERVQSAIGHYTEIAAALGVSKASISRGRDIVLSRQTAPVTAVSAVSETPGNMETARPPGGPPQRIHQTDRDGG